MNFNYYICTYIHYLLTKLVNMTKKHFKAIAEAIKNNSTTVNRDGKMKHVINQVEFINDLLVFFKSENNLFNEDRFLEACGIITSV